MADGIDKFADDVNRLSIENRPRSSFSLHSGGMSESCINIGESLRNPHIMQQAGRLIVARAAELGIEYQIVAGSGNIGNLLALVISRKSIGAESYLVYEDMAEVDMHDYSDMTKIINRRVLVVGDIASSGSSLIELTQSVRGEGGIVEAAITVADREQECAVNLAEIGVAYHSLLVFDKTQGLFVPAAV
jgi:orotate phosphoribosyltransferase